MRLFRVLNRFLFSEEKNTKCLRVFSVLADSSYKFYIPLHCSWSDKAPMPPKKILNVDFSYLPKAGLFKAGLRQPRVSAKFELRNESLKSKFSLILLVNKLMI